MKSLIEFISVSCLTLLFFNPVHGQDIIVYKNGNEIKVVVQEVGLESVKYKKYENVSGPMYVEKKDLIFMIKYENGTKDVFGLRNDDQLANDQTKVINKDPINLDEKKLSFKTGFFALRYYQGGNKISKAKFIQLLKQDPEAYSYYSSYGTVKAFDRLFNVVTWGFTLGAVYYSFEDQRNLTIGLAISGLVSGIISSVLSRKAKSKVELAVITYNKNLQRHDTVE